MRKIILDLIVIVMVALFILVNVVFILAEHNYQLGEDKAEAKDFEEALSFYEEASRILPGHASYSRAVGQTCLKLYNADSGNLRPLHQAYAAYKRVLDADGLYPYGWFEMARVLEALRQVDVFDLPSPESYFRRALEIDPGNPLFQAGMIRWLIGNGQLQEAREIFIRLAKIYPSMISAFGDPLLTSEDELNRFGRELGNNAAARVAFANYLIKIKRPDLAAEQLELVPRKSLIRYNVAIEMANALHGLGRKEEAKQVLEEAMAANPHITFIALKLASLHVEEGEFAAAIAVYQQALKDNPEQWDLNLSIARYSRRIGDHDAAIDYFRRALASGAPTRDQQKQIHVWIGEIKKERGDYQGALVEYRMALELDPQDENLLHVEKWLEVKMEYKGKPD